LLTIGYRDLDISSKKNWNENEDNQKFLWKGEWNHLLMCVLCMNVFFSWMTIVVVKGWNCGPWSLLSSRG
jgi:hypothetical protein